MTSTFIKQTFQKMGQHKDLLPLFGACLYAGCLSITMLVYTSVRKSDVRFNRWSKQDPFYTVDATRPTQKIITALSLEKNLFGERFTEEKKLHQFIYGDGDYKV